MNGDGFLQNDFAAVRNFVDKMHRCTRDLDAVGKRRFVHAQTVEALAAERRDQRRMNIDDAPRPVTDKIRAQNGHESRKDDQLDAVGLQRRTDSVFKCLLIGTFPARDDGGRNVVFVCAGERVRIAAGG